MERWEYMKLDLNDLPRNKDSIDVLNNAGREGWELTHLTANHFAYLKRLIEETAPAKPARRKPAGSTT